MKKIHLNTLLVFIVISLFLFNKKNSIINVSENQLCSTKFKQTIIYHGPNNQNKARIILKPNYPLLVLERRKSWLKVIDPENRVGWIKKANISNEPRAFVKNKIITEENVVIMPQVSLKIIEEKKDYTIVEYEGKQMKINKKNNDDLWTGNKNI